MAEEDPKKTPSENDENAPPLIEDVGEGQSADERTALALREGNDPIVIVPREGEPAEPVGAALQLGTKRFVYAAYFGGAIAVAFLTSKLLGLAWQRLSAWKPMFGEPRDEIVMGIGAVTGAIAATYYWRRTRARELAEEVASELSKVTWPSRKEVTNSTTVVIVTTIFATIFFALIDQFWRFVSDKIYLGT